MLCDAPNLRDRITLSLTRKLKVMESKNLRPKHLTVQQAELREANASRRELVARVEQKNQEIAEKSKTAEGYLAKVMSASGERTRVEGQLREANHSRAAFESAKARMEQEASLLQQHNEWLRAELSKKSEELLAARKSGSAEVLQAAHALEEAQREAASARRELGVTKEAAAAAQAQATRAHEELRVGGGTSHNVICACGTTKVFCYQT
jgi:nucleoprotein TPR